MRHEKWNTSRPRLERLEDRTLLSGVSFGNGILTIAGTAGNDVARVYLYSVDFLASTRVILNGVVYEFPGDFPTQVRFYGGAGNDDFRNYLSASTLAYGGTGNDKLYVLHPVGRFWGHYLNGGPGDDWLQGGNSRNVIVGEGGNDILIGVNSFNDYLYGGHGNDQLYGRSQEGPYSGDRLYGGPGDDFLDGGGEGYADLLVGGDGADTFRIDWVWTGSRWINVDSPRDYTPWLGDRLIS